MCQCIAATLVSDISNIRYIDAVEVSYSGYRALVRISVFGCYAVACQVLSQVSFRLTVCFIIPGVKYYD
ncbi:MAG: hypothetical protein E7117_01330 [Bacteroidales bacterium]|nr:hypothetical protein [Bacteroidales bacterium]